MSALDTLTTLDAPARLAARDASLFAETPAEQAEVTANLGWTALAADAPEALARIAPLAQELRDEGLTDVVLLGMGGSSLASLVIGEVLAGDGAGPHLHVLDTTSPVSIVDAVKSLPFESSVFLVSSKSGTTIEPLSLYAIFRGAADDTLGVDEAGRRFIAVTDPGTPLETFAAAQGFRAVVNSPATVGGRYSALTVFGLLPAALLGVDVDALIERALPVERACAAPAEDNPAAALAAFAADWCEAGRDKLTIVSSPGLESFGLWVEQLVAESLGKHHTGILPVVELSPSKPIGYGPDRCVVAVRFESDARLAGWAEDLAQHVPVHEIVLRDPYDLGAEFVRWEHAVALMGPLMGVNPFGQPNVAAAKAATAEVLEGRVMPPQPTAAVSGVGLTFAGTLPDPAHTEASLATGLGHAIAALETDDYLAILAYLPADEELLAPLSQAIPAISAELGVPVTLEIGPRYLHSTGQYHKGGPNRGVFMLVTTRDETDLPVPGQTWGLAALHRAQAEGDLVTLAENERRVLRVDLEDASEDSLAMFVSALADACGVVLED